MMQNDTGVLTPAKALRGADSDEGPAYASSGTAWARRDANVIPFPIVSQPPASPELAPLAWVIVGLRRVGEPATSAEIAEAVADAPVPESVRTSAAVDGVLSAYARQGGAPGLFRQVSLRGSEAWGFTPEFRFALRRAGFQPVSRGE